LGTAELRATVLRIWASSPARFREDANAEELLSLGYGGRVLAELAANGAAAARAVGVPAGPRIELRPADPAGRPAELRVANTGAPLTADGVAALAALRASAKRDDDGVGHFGVGFTAVRALSDAPAVVSTSGAIRFAAADTVTAVESLDVPELAAELRRRGGHVPALRLPWTVPAGAVEGPPPGYTTEVRLPLRDGVDAGALAAGLTVDLAMDLMWALPELATVTLPGHRLQRTDLPDGITEITVDPPAERHRFRTVDAGGTLPPVLLANRPVEERGRTRWHLTWVLPVDADGRPRPVRRSTVGAPTPTDEPVSLPARLVGTFPVDENRSRLATGPLADHLLRAAADAYLDLLLALPGPDRLALIPAGGFPLGDVDATLRRAIADRLADTAFLIDAGDTPVTPGRASMVAGLAGPAATAVSEAIPGLLDWPAAPADVERLQTIGVGLRSVSSVTAALAALDRPAEFWPVVYDALSEVPADELADLPVPRQGGGTMVGPRGVLIPADLGSDARGLADAVARLVPGLRLAALDHPLLRRLGAESADADSILRSAALEGEIRRRRDDLDYQDPDPEDLADFAALVLGLVAAGGSGGVDQGSGATAEVLLTDADGEAWPAGDLLLPGAPLATVLADDADLAEVAPAWVQRWGAELLSRAGVRSGFGVRRYPAPPTDDTDLDDVQQWWDEQGAADPADTFAAVPDLDLVDPDAWPAALALLAGDRSTRDALRPTASGHSYTGWWLARHARVQGRPPRAWRTPDADDLAGLYDPIPVPLPSDVAGDIGVLRTLEDAAADPAELLRRWADGGRTVPPETVPALTAALIAALADGPDVELPDGVRTLSGEVAAAGSAAVLDVAWLAQVADPARVVAGGGDPETVAEVLDLPLASETFRHPLDARSTGGRSATLGEIDGGARCLALCRRSDLADRPVRVVAGLAVTGPAADGAVPERSAIPVHWWRDGGDLLLDGSPDGIGRAVAWLAGRWGDRHTLVAAARGDRAELAESGRS
jgi:hypothetical protein